MTSDAFAANPRRSQLAVERHVPRDDLLNGRTALVRAVEAFVLIDQKRVFHLSRPPLDLEAHANRCVPAQRRAGLSGIDIRQ